MSVPSLTNVNYSQMSDEMLTSLFMMKNKEFLLKMNKCNTLTCDIETIKIYILQNVKTINSLKEYMNLEEKAASLIQKSTLEVYEVAAEVEKLKSEIFLRKLAGLGIK